MCVDICSDGAQGAVGKSWDNLNQASGTTPSFVVTVFFTYVHSWGKGFT